MWPFPELRVRTLYTLHVTDAQSHARQLLYIKVTLCGPAHTHKHTHIHFQGQKKVRKAISHPDGQHHMGVALQDLHCVTVRDLIEADPVGCEDLVPHFDAMLLCESTWVQPQETKQTTVQTQMHFISIKQFS